MSGINCQNYTFQNEDRSQNYTHTIQKLQHSEVRRITLGDFTFLIIT